MALWGWRANFGLSPSPAPAKPMDLVFIEVTGAGGQPGVYAFDHFPSPSEVWAKAGIPGVPPRGEARLASGTRLALSPDAGYRISRMSGTRLLALGLAIDLNTASAADLGALPGIGPALAARTVDYRAQHGPFKRVEDLEQVFGIGPQNLAKLKPYLWLESAGAPAPSTRAQPGGEPLLETSPASEAQGRRPWDQRPAKALARVIDPNRASKEDLECLPGIGPVLAQRILDYRRVHGPFKKADDLTQVSGIGLKKLEKIKPFVMINGQKPAAPGH